MTNRRLFQATLVVLLGLALAVTACAPRRTPPPAGDLTRALTLSRTARPTATSVPRATATGRAPAPANRPTVFRPREAPVLHLGWTSYTNGNWVSDLAFGPDGSLWTVGSGGVVRWDLANKTYTKYTVEHGLADNSVFSLAVAPDGVLWFGTAAGVSRFDGESWATYASGDAQGTNSIMSIDVAPDGAAWFSAYSQRGTRLPSRGVSRFDGKTLTAYTEEDGLVDDWISSVAAASDGSLWFGSEHGVSRFDGQTWTTYTARDGLASDAVGCIVPTPNGAVWFGTAAGLSRFDGRTWATYTSADGLAGDGITSIAVAPDGALWAGTWGGVSRFDGKTWTTYVVSDSPEPYDITAIAVAPDGALWAGTLQRGVARYDGRTWTAYVTGDSLASNSVSSVALAGDGTVWAGTLPGLSRFDGQAWVTYTSEDGLAADAVASMAVAPDGTLWLGSDRGLSRFDGRTWVTYSSEDGLAWNRVRSVVVSSEGVLWAGTDKGISRYDGEVWDTFTIDDGLPSDQVMHVATGRAGTLWASTSRGIVRFDGETWTTQMLGFSGVDSLAVAPDGTLWIGTQNGILRLNGEAQATLHTDHWVWSIAVEPDGALWFGTDRGALRYDGQSWLRYTTADGLAHNFVHAIAVSSDGVLWFGTAQGGVSRYMPSMAPAPISPEPASIELQAWASSDNQVQSVRVSVVGQDGEPLRCSGHIEFRILDRAEGQETTLLYQTGFDITAADLGRGYYQWEIPMADITKSGSTETFGLVDARAELVFTTPRGTRLEAHADTQVHGLQAAWEVEIGEVTVTPTSEDSRHPWTLSIPMTITNVGDADLPDMRVYCMMCVPAEAKFGYLPKGASDQLVLNTVFWLNEQLHPGQEFRGTVELEVQRFLPDGATALGKSYTKEIALVVPLTTATPTAASTPAPGQVGIVPGHWDSSAGTVCPDGLAEAEINLEIAQRVVSILSQSGVDAELVPESTISDSWSLRDYPGVVLVGIHAGPCDGSADSGFEIIRSIDSVLFEFGNELVACLMDAYQRATGLQSKGDRASDDVSHYGALLGSGISFPATIVELGTMDKDRELLTESPDLVAQGIAEGIICFLGQESAQ